MEKEEELNKITKLIDEFIDHSQQDKVQRIADGVIEVIKLARQLGVSREFFMVVVNANWSAIEMDEKYWRCALVGCDIKRYHEHKIEGPFTEKKDG